MRPRAEEAKEEKIVSNNNRKADDDFADGEIDIRIWITEENVWEENVAGKIFRLDAGGRARDLLH